VLHVDGGERRPLDRAALLGLCAAACAGLGEAVIGRTMLDSALRNLYDGVPHGRRAAGADPRRAHADRARAGLRLRHRPPAAGQPEREVLGSALAERQWPAVDAEYLPAFIQRASQPNCSTRAWPTSTCPPGAALKPERDLLFGYLGLQTLYDRYFLHIDGRRIELPQIFFMRVAMGLALNEIDREARAIEFYDLISSFDFMCSTPTLFNSGTAAFAAVVVLPDHGGRRPRRHLPGIKENALLQKYAGGLGNDWTPVRALGSRIKGTNGQSQGVIPFLKVVNDTAVAVNQGGKRKGAVCAYLETWHLDIEEFLELRKNTGDERRRTHDMNTANWIPDLFMKRVHRERRVDAVLAGRCARPARQVRRALSRRPMSPTKPGRRRPD
jgi:ribonucleoside-diphosphate reductase alpha chain